MKAFIDFSKLHWQSDWNGDEVGYDDINIVGLYSWIDYVCGGEILFYIDMETMEVLDFFVQEDTKLTEYCSCGTK